MVKEKGPEGERDFSNARSLCWGIKYRDMQPATKKYLLPEERVDVLLDELVVGTIVGMPEKDDFLTLDPGDRVVDVVKSIRWLSEETRGKILVLVEGLKGDVQGLLRKNKGDEDGDEVEEIVNEGLLTLLREQYDELSEDKRMRRGRVLSWEEVQTAIPRLDVILAEVRTLTDPRVLCLADERRLILVGGRDDESLEEGSGRVPRHVKRGDTQFLYVNESGEVDRVGSRGKIQIPSGGQKIAERGDLTQREGMWLGGEAAAAADRDRELLLRDAAPEVHVEFIERVPREVRGALRIDLDFSRPSASEA